MSRDQHLVEAGTRAPARCRLVRHPRLDAELLLAHAIGVDRSAVIAHGDAPVGADAAAAYEAFERGARWGRAGRVHREDQGIPRLALTVDARALIPRPETEAAGRHRDREVMAA
jgi:release factor glutamine methyltransferase